MQETIWQIALISAVLTVGLEQIFDTNWWNRWFGKGIDGQLSRFFPGYDPRPWIASALGIYLALAFKLDAVSGVLDITAVGGWIGTGGHYVNQVMTGLVLGGGAKTIKKFVKVIGQFWREVQALLGQFGK